MLTRVRCALAIVITMAATAAWGAPAAVVEAPKGEAKKQAVVQTALDRYVAQADDSFAWTQVARHDEEDATVLVVDLTSQTWRNPDEIDRPVWKHWLSIIIPNAATGDTALLLIGGGANGGEAPEGPSDRARKVALATGSVVAELGQVPNQPLIFRGDGKPRKEDDLVARSWVECLKTGDSTWVAQLPMTKSAVRAMDATQAAVKAAGFPAIEHFVVAGGSKRGWTTWLTAAVDRRVVAIAPVVIDVVNVQPSMQNHHAAYGFWSASLNDYESQGLAKFFNNPLAGILFSLVDPYAYRARLTMPKCIINATGDQYFTPDSSKFYFDDLKGEKLLYYVPNADHSLDGSDALDTLIAFHASVLRGLARPKVHWSLDEGGAWRVSSDMTPKRATLWHAENEKARDFRVHAIGKAFSSEELKPDAKGEFVAPCPMPMQGYAAYVVVLEYDIGAPTPLRVSTPVNIVPDTLPFAEQ